MPSLPAKERRLAQSEMRAVVDANVWIKALISPGGPQDKLLKAAMEHRFTPVFSEPMLSELRVVLRRPAIAKLCHMENADITATISYLRQLSNMVKVTGAYILCRDPEDNKIIETAVRGGAPIIVSQDSDLCDPALREPLAELGIRVIVAAEFLELLP